MQRESLYVGIICFFAGALATAGMVLFLVPNVSPSARVRMMNGNWGMMGGNRVGGSGTDATGIQMLIKNYQAGAVIAGSLAAKTKDASVRDLANSEKEQLQAEVDYLSSWLTGESTK